MSYTFYPGQDIVCIKDHSKGIVKEGDCFVVKGVRPPICSCGYALIDIGIKTETNFFRCNVCYTDIIIQGNAQWIGESLFAPLDRLTDITEIEEILSIAYLRLNQITL